MKKDRCPVTEEELSMNITEEKEKTPKTQSPNVHFHDWGGRKACKRWTKLAIADTLEAGIPRISSNFNGAGASTPTRRALNERLNMVSEAHRANKVGPPRVMTGFARGPALIAFYLFGIFRYTNWQRTSVPRGATSGPQGPPRLRQARAPRDSLVSLDLATD